MAAVGATLSSQVVAPEPRLLFHVATVSSPPPRGSTVQNAPAAVALGATFLCLGASRRHSVPTPRRVVRVARRERGKQGGEPLNVLQEKAVRAKLCGQHLIIAGAGSGKTRVLTERLAYFLKDCGVDPSKVLLLTFTKSAAEEMKQRCELLVGSNLAKQVLASTFHGFCARVLRRYAKEVELENNFIIMDESEAVTLIGTARKNLGFNNKVQGKMPRAAELRKLFSLVVSLGEPLRTVLLEPRFWSLRDMADSIESCLEEYKNLKRARNCVDYDDLLVFCERALQKPDVCNKIARTYEYILVDEYQDTDKLQASILQRIIQGSVDAKQGNVTVVGDDAQGIYGFRGASIENIYDFEQTFPDVSIFKLEQNYRSHQPILDLANGVMSLAQQGYRKTLFSHVPGGEKPQLGLFRNATTEAQWVLQQLKLLRAENVAWRDIAVLFRRRKASTLVQAEMQSEGSVPFRLVGGPKWTDSAHARDLFSILYCAFFPRHQMAWKRVLTMFKGIGDKISEQIYADAFEQSRLRAELWQDKPFGEDLSSLADLIQQLRTLNEDPKECVTLVRQWYLPYFQKKFREDYEERMDDFLIFEDFVRKWKTMQDALMEGPLMQEPGEADRDVVTLSTIHAAKGLEWDYVFIIDLQEPFLSEPKEEELRVMYVGITRARRKLFLSCPGPILSYWLHNTPDLEQLVDMKDLSHFGLESSE